MRTLVFAGRASGRKKVATPLAIQVGMLALVLMPAVVQAQFTFATNGMAAITITGYTGAGGAVTIPSEVNGLPVTWIGMRAFYNCTNVTSVTIPNSVAIIDFDAFHSCLALTNVTIGESVTQIRDGAFYFCIGLTDVLLPNSVTKIGYWTFGYCESLTNVAIPEGVTEIDNFAFAYCYSLPKIIIPNNVDYIGTCAFSTCIALTGVTIGSKVQYVGDNAFSWCSRLTTVVFKGNTPSLGSGVFAGADKATVYYLPGTTCWGSTFGGRPTVLWNPQAQSFGVGTNGLCFTITGPTNLAIVVEACTDLAGASWTPVSTNTLTGGSSPFIDPQWANYPNRFYRFQSP